MGVIESKTFRNGDSAAVELPDALGIPIGVAVRLEWEGQIVTIRPASDAIDTKRTWADVLAKLAAIGPVGEIGERLPVVVPRRPGDR